MAGEEVLERAAEAGEFERLRARHAPARGAARPAPGRSRARRCGPGRERIASGIGLALAWHGAGFTGSGEVKLASVASLELTADGRIRILTASTEMGQGTKTIFPQLVAEALGVAVRGGRDRAAGHGVRARLAARPSRRGRRWSSAGCSSRPPGGCATEVETATGGPFAATYRDYARDARRRSASTSASSRTRASASTTRRTAATPTRPSAGRPASRRVDVDLDTGEVHVRDVVAADDIGRVIHPVLAEGQVEGGTLQAVGYATIEEIKLRDGRYLNDRLATYIIPTSLDAPRITTILVEAPFAGRAARREGGRRAADGRRGAGRRGRHRRRDRRLDHGPAGQPGADPRRAGRRAGRGAAAAGRVRARRRRAADGPPP